MNLKALSTGSMLSVTGGWKEDAEIRTVFVSNAVGAVLFGAVEGSHDFLAAQFKRRIDVNLVLKLITEKLTAADVVFDSKSRAAYYGFESLAEGSDTAERAAYYRRLQTTLFPWGLQVTQFSYREEVGATIQIRQIATPELMAELEAIPLGDRTMADMLRAWLQAGDELGQKLRERDQVLESLTKSGTAITEIDARGSRLRWIRTVRALLASLDLIEMSDTLRERMLAPLKRAVAQAGRARGGQGEPEGEEDGSEDDVDGDIDDTGEEPDSDIETDASL